MNVDETEPRDLKQRVREDSAVCGYDPKVRVQGSKRLQKALVPEPLGLKNRSSMLQGNALYRSGLRLMAAAACPVGLRDDPDK